MTTTFARFPARLQEAIVSRLGWTSLRPVQELAGQAILDGMNAVVLAPTSGGKTEAAIFPALAQMIEDQPTVVGVIYVAPIKALLNNQEERLGTYTEMVGMHRFVWHGDTTDSAKRAFVREPAELLMTTPESLEVMLLSSRSPAPKLFGDLRLVVIDEVHALAGTDRGAHLMSVLERVARYSKHDVQRVGLSATVGNPPEILRWLQGSSKREGVVIDPPKPPSPREIQVVMAESPGTLAADVALRARGHKSLLFCQSRSLTETLAERMRGQDIDVFVHHSSVSLEDRRAAEERFHHGTNACIVCTSTLELGIDVGDLHYVFQAGAPSSVSSFLQRMGRTGRREGTTANTTFFCESVEEIVQAIALVELARERWVESVAAQTRCWPVLLHQLLAMTLQHGAISADRCWEQLSRVPDFAGISRVEFDALVEHMRAQDYLFEAGGLLSMGQKAERVFGRKNFMEMYAVFSSPVLYRVVQATGAEVGSIEQNFVDRLVEGMSSFLLGGRAWVVEAVNHKEKTVRVAKAPGGQKPTWGGALPQLLGHDVCQRVRAVLLSNATYPYLTPPATEALEEKRKEMRLTLGRDGRAIQYSPDAAMWWTYAGGRINHTLKHGLEYIGGWKVVADNFSVRIKGDGIEPERVAAAIGTLGQDAFWKDERTWRDIIARLPAYRLSKFQQAMPDHCASEMIAAYLLDVDGMLGWLER